MLAEIKDVIKGYGLRPVLDGISLSIGAADRMAIVGPSGSGKSTLLNILGTLDKPDSGQVMMDGKEVGKMDEDALAGLRRSRIGYVFQLHYLLPQLTLLENVLLPVLPFRDKNYHREASKRAHRLIEKVGLTDHMYRRPAALSVGECQRAAVVRALINRPGLLLADEPTGSLDNENALRLGDLLVTLNREEGVAIVMVTHSAELASKMGLIFRLLSGKLQLQS